jgi:hypothetical protein
MIRPFDARSRHLRRVRRLKLSARGWAVWASTVGGAAAVAVPYAGLGLPDVGWAGVAGGSIALAALRWRDYRAAAVEPVPPPPPARVPGQSLGQWIAPLVGPTFAPLVDRPRRVSVPPASSAAPAAARLNAASRALPPLLGRLGGVAGDTAAEAHHAHRALRELAVRITLVERTLATAPAPARESLTRARDGLLRQFDDGVEAYERFAASAAECVAAYAGGGDTLAARRLHEASDALSGLAAGLTEVNDRNTAYGLFG